MGRISNYIYIYGFGNKMKEQRPSACKLSVGNEELKCGWESDGSVSKCCTLFQNDHWYNWGGVLENGFECHL